MTGYLVQTDILRIHLKHDIIYVRNLNIADNVIMLQIVVTSFSLTCYNYLWLPEFDSSSFKDN